MEAYFLRRLLWTACWVQQRAQCLAHQLIASLSNHGALTRWVRTCQPLELSSIRKQDPAAADKLAKIQRDLDETKIILHKTIESVLDRGEKLDQVCWWGLYLKQGHLLFWE